MCHWRPTPWAHGSTNMAILEVSATAKYIATICAPPNFVPWLPACLARTSRSCARSCYQNAATLQYHTGNIIIITYFWLWVCAATFTTSWRIVFEICGTPRRRENGHWQTLITSQLPGSRAQPNRSRWGWNLWRSLRGHLYWLLTCYIFFFI